MGTITGARRYGYLILEIDRAKYAAIPAGETPRFSAALGTIAPANCGTQGPWRLCKAPHQDRYRYGSTRNRRGRDPVKFAHSSPCELAFKLPSCARTRVSSSASRWAL